MFILDLTYVAPLEAADAVMGPHMDWVNEGYTRGLFLASGRKNPRTGGVILAKGTRDEIEAYCAADPFTIHAIAEYRITEMAVTRTAAALDALKD